MPEFRRPISKQAEQVWPVIVRKGRTMTAFAEWNDYCPEYISSKVLATRAKLWTKTIRKELTMGLPNKDEVKGKLNKAKGAAKESIGRTLGDREMENKGAKERQIGTAQENLGEAKRELGDAVKDMGDTIRK